MAKKTATKKKAAGSKRKASASKRSAAKRSAAKRSAAKRPAARKAARATRGPAKTGQRVPARTAAKAKRPSIRKKAVVRAPKPTRVAKQKNAARAAASRSARRNPTPKPSTLASAATAVKGAVAGAMAAVARRLPGASAEVDAITLLETDHRRLEALFKQGEDTTTRAVQGRSELLNTLTKALTIHELIEEKVLYPALEAYPEARDIVLEGFQEHHVADVIVKELHEVARNDEEWGPKFKVLKENIEHHIQEEEGPMFRTARGVMTSEELLALGVKMAKMKAEAERG